jgi:hypothetical protein
MARSTLYTSPALRVIAPRSATADAPFALRHGTGIVVGFGKAWLPFEAGTVVSHALANNEDPIAAYERAVERGHETHWLHAQGTVVHSGPHRQALRVGLQIGDVVRLEGRDFVLTAARNRNVDLVPATATTEG